MLLAAFAAGFAEGIVVSIFNFVNALAGSAVNLVLTVLVGAFIAGWTNSLPVLFYRDFLGKKS